MTRGGRVCPLGSWVYGPPAETSGSIVEPGTNLISWLFLDPETPIERMTNYEDDDDSDGDVGLLQGRGDDHVRGRRRVQDSKVTRKL